MKKYKCITPEGEINYYNTMREIAADTGLDLGLISRYLSGKRKTIGASNPGRPPDGIPSNKRGYIITICDK